MAPSNLPLRSTMAGSCLISTHKRRKASSRSNPLAPPQCSSLRDHRQIINRLLGQVGPSVAAEISLKRAICKSISSAKRSLLNLSSQRIWSFWILSHSISEMTAAHLPQAAQILSPRPLVDNKDPAKITAIKWFRDCSKIVALSWRRIISYRGLLKQEILLVVSNHIALLSLLSTQSSWRPLTSSETIVRRS